MKKLSLIAAAMLAGVLLTGCGQDTPQQTQSSVPAKEVVQDKATATADAAKAMAEDAREKAEAMTEAAKERTAEAADMAKEKAADIKEGAADMAEKAVDKAEELKDATGDSELMKKAEDTKNALMDMKK